MDMGITLDSVCIPSENVVARLIMDELVIVPITSGIGDEEDELYSLNETGQVIWRLLDGKKTLREIIQELSSEFNASAGELADDVIGLVTELVKKKIVIQI